MLLDTARSTRALVLAGIVVTASACGASVEDAYMAKDPDGQQKTETFNKLGDEMFICLRVVGGDEDTQVKLHFSEGRLQLTDDTLFPWPNSQAQGPVDLRVQLYIPDPKTGERRLRGPWPVGSYSFDVLIDDEIEDTVDFSVR